MSHSVNKALRVIDIGHRRPFAEYVDPLAASMFVTVRVIVLIGRGWPEYSLQTDGWNGSLSEWLGQVVGLTCSSQAGDRQH